MEAGRLKAPGLEPGLAAVALAMGLLTNTWAEVTWPVVALDSVLFVGCAFVGFFPRVASAVLLTAMSAKLAIPPEQLSLGPLVGVIPIVSLTGRSAPHAGVLSFAFAAALQVVMVFAYEGFPPSLAGFSVMLVLTGLALLAGLFWRRYEDRLRAHRAEASAQRSELRRELARDLHDTLAQSLGHIAMRAWLAADEPGTATAAKRSFEAIAEEASSAAADLRQMLSILREASPALESASGSADVRPLRAEVELQTRRLAEAGLRPEVVLEISALSAVRSLTLAKIVVEVANNMLKHALPGGRCTISLVETESAVVGTFTNPVRSGPERRGGMGLVGMSERLGLLRGTLQTSTEDGIWTTAITLPRG